MTVSATSEPEFDSILKANKYVMVDFWAEWCPPCKAVAPIYEKLAKANEVDGGLAFVKLDIDRVPEVSARFQVSTIPTFLVFEDGKPYAVDVAAAGKTAGAGAQMVAGKVSLIRGADPRSLTAVAESLSKLAKAAPAPAPEKAADEPAAPKDDGSTVSGGYTLGEQGGKRADWKTSLN